MKRSGTLLFRFLFCIALLYSCNKPDFPYPNTPKCQITKLIGEILFNDSILITYNNKGNPVSMTRTHVGTGAPNFFFRYDKNNRLTDIIGAYSNNLEFETWHHYVYGNSTYGNELRPITDTVYTFGVIGTGPLPAQIFYGVRYTDFSYDRYGRIIVAKEVDVRPITGSRELRYYYNAAGNLVSLATTYPQGVDSINIVNYDNKINAHQTHPIWQLIDRDYSINNPFTAISYNNFGLPTIIGGKESAGDFLGYDFVGELKIDYDCRGSATK